MSPAVDLSQTRFLVTGANSGIGLALVEALAARNARLVLTCRSEPRADEVRQSLLARHPALDVSTLSFDISDLASVREAAGRFLSGGGPLDVLVNNAGIAGTKAVTRDGFDLTYATNYIGPWLLTNLLLPRLRESSRGRVVNVASGAHFSVKEMEWHGLERRTEPHRAAFHDYAVTKLMNVLHAAELARRSSGSRMTTYAVHPGAVASNIWRKVPEPVRSFLKLFMLSNQEGAKTPLYCATTPELAAVSGRYYARETEMTPSPLARDAGLARELWERTEALAG